MAEMRKALEFSKQEAETLRQENAGLAALKEKAAQFAAWEETKKKLETELQEAAPFRDLYAIQKNPTFAETYIRPMDEIRENLVKLAKDYRAPDPESNVDALLSATSSKERNDLLAGLFGDEALPIDEARSSVMKYIRIKQSRAEAEAAPRETLKKIQAAEQEAASILAVQIAQQAEIAREAGFKNALNVNAGEKFGIDALIEIPGNKEHNARRQAILNDAHNLHKQTIDHVLKHGGRMSTALSGFLASLTQMAGASSIALQEAGHYKKLAHQFAAELDKMRGMSKPRAVTSPRSASEPPPAGPPGTGMSQDQVAKAVWDTVTNETATAE